MAEFLQIGILPVALTLGAYQIGLLCQKKLRSPVCNPILIGVVIVLAFLKLTGMESRDYQAGTAAISWLMTPATVCLAIPMYEQFQALRKNLKAIVAGIVSGTVVCLTVMLAFALLAGYDRSLIVSLLPKSVTSAIGVPLSELSGGIASITTAAIIFTGITANVMGTFLCRIFRLTDDAAKGVALGTSGHVIATTKANELSPLTGAVSSLSLVIAGLLTAILFPLIAQLI